MKNQKINGIFHIFFWKDYFWVIKLKNNGDFLWEAGEMEILPKSLEHTDRQKCNNKILKSKPQKSEKFNEIIKNNEHEQDKSI